MVSFTMQELYDYVFKRAVAEVDTLINLARAGSQQHTDLTGARALLLLSRPELAGGNPIVEPPKGANSEKVSESFVKSSAEAGLDFRGEWICENGETAEVQNFEGGSWVGSRKGVGTTIWDPNGCHVSPRWNLKDRIRQGKNYK